MQYIPENRFDAFNLVLPFEVYLEGSGKNFHVSVEIIGLKIIWFEDCYNTQLGV